MWRCSRTETSTRTVHRTLDYSICHERSGWLVACRIMHNDLLARTRFQGRSLHVPAQLLFFGQWEGRSNRSETVGRTLSSAMGCDEAIEVAAPASKSHHNCLRVHIDYCDSDCESENAIVHKMSTATSLVERGSDEISPEGFFFNILNPGNSMGLQGVWDNRFE